MTVGTEVNKNIFWNQVKQLYIFHTPLYDFPYSVLYSTQICAERNRVSHPSTPPTSASNPGLVT